MKNPLLGHLVPSRPISKTIGNYVDASVYPQHDSLSKTEDLQMYIKRRVLESPHLAIAFQGPPAAGKSKYGQVIQTAILDVLSKINQLSPFFSYTDPYGEKKSIGGFVNKDVVLALFAADYFFGVVGPKRNDGRLLSDIQTYATESTHYGAGFSTARDLLSGQKPNEKIYMGTQIEKDQEARLGEIEMHKKPKIKPDHKKIIVIEGVNAGVWLKKTQKIQERMNFRTLEILFNMSIEDSYIRMLRRDHDAKGYSYSRIHEQRLREYYYIFQLYIEPAFRNPNTLLFSKTRDIPPFSQTELHENIEVIIKLRERFLYKESLTAPEHKKFIDILSTSLLKQFRSMHGFSDADLSRWHEYKKAKELANGGKGLPNLADKIL